MTATIELNSARRKLQSALGEDKSPVYFGHMKAWFRKKKSKEDFDLEARGLFSAEHAHLHNEFLLAILNKCQTLANFTGPSSHASSKCVPNANASELLSPRLVIHHFIILEVLFHMTSFLQEILRPGL